MDLSNDQLKQLREVLLDAFPTQIKVAEMVRFGLNKKLDYIVQDGSLQEIISRIIIEAESQKWINDLIFASYEWNPENQRLKRFYLQYKAMLDESERKYVNDSLSFTPNTDIEQQRLLDVAQRLLPDVVLKNPRFQFQQHTLHITCALILAPGTVDHIKTMFRQRTGWTLGITLLPQKTRVFTEDPLVFIESSELEKRRLLDVAQQLLPPSVILRSSSFQFQQRTLHITCVPVLAADMVDHIKTMFRQRTGWTLGITLLPQQAASSRESSRRLVSIAQQLLPQGVELQNPTFQFQQRTLHITCVPILAADMVDHIKTMFRQRTGWTLGITLLPQQAASSSENSSHFEKNSELMTQRRLIDIAQQVLPQGVELQNPILQSQQRTLHIICTSILAPETVEQAKAKFRNATNWTLGITLPSQQKKMPVSYSPTLSNTNEQEEKHRLLEIALRLLPQGVTLRDSVLQLQQHTLHITCTPILAPEIVESIKAKFQLTTGFTLGITAFSLEWNEIFESSAQHEL
jgi:DNA polymerase III psi subunit